MSKYVVHTVSQIYNRYYVEVNDPEWAGESIVCNELDPFASTDLNESVLYYEKVDDWPVVNKIDVNGAGYVCKTDENGEFVKWEQLTLWEYAK